MNGAILYHLLSGHAPFKGNSEDVLRRLKDQTPPPLPPAAPRDLASIAAKAMARDRDDRYPSAKELAAELTAFQAGRLVSAHEYTRGELVRRWVRKRRGMLAVVAVAVVALGVFGAFALRRIIDERDTADEQRAVAETQRTQSQALSTALLVEQGRQEALAGRTERAAALLAEALRADPTDVVTRQLLGPVMRSLEATERLQPPSIDSDHVEDDARIEASPDGARYLVRQNKRIWVSESRPNAPIIQLGELRDAEWPHFSPDGRWVVGVAEAKSTIRLWSATTGKLAWSVVEPKVTWAGFSRDGTLVIAITGDGSWGTWAVASGNQESFVKAVDKGIGARPAATHASTVVDALLPIATADGRVSVWDWRRAVRIAQFEHGGELGTPFSTAADQRTVVTCGLDGRIKRWDARTGKLLGTMLETTGAVATCTLAPTGHVASCTPIGTIRVWSPAGTITTSFEGEPSVLWLSGDATRLLQQSMGRDVNLRDTTTGTLLASFGVSAIVGAPGERLFFARPDGAIDTAPLRQGIVRELARPTLPRPKESDRDWRSVLLPAPGGGASLLDVASKRRVPLQLTSPIAISDDGANLVGWSASGITVTTAGGKIERVIPAAAPPIELRISDDARRVAARFTDHRVVVWDVPTGNVIGALEADHHELMFFDPAGRLGLWTDLGPFSLWDPHQAQPFQFTHRLWMLEYTSDGSLLAVSDSDFVSIHDATTGARKLLVQGMVPAFDRVGHVAIRNGDEVSIWSTTSWTRTAHFAIASPLSAAAISSSPDGLLIATSTGIWETQRGRQLAAFAHDSGAGSFVGGNLQTRVDTVQFSRDGTELIVESESGLRVWDVRPETRDVDEVVSIVASRQPWRVIDGQLVLPKAAGPAPAITSIRGRAIRGGIPVPGAPVIVVAAKQFRQLGVTSADGTFEIVLPPGQHAVSVGDEKVGAFGSAELTASDHPSLVDIPLTFEASVAGRVIDGSGRPRAGILVTLDIPDDPDSGRSTTGPDGTFQIRALKGSLTYNVKLVDTATGMTIATRNPVPRLTLASSTTHLEGLELQVDNAPPLLKGIDSTVYVRLTTRWQPTRSLDVAYPAGHLVFRATGAFGGQLWKLSPDGAAFRLSTQSLGDAKRLGTAGDDVSLVDNGSQTWTFEPLDGAYRLRLTGDPRCLAAGLRLALVECAATPEQQWLLTPTTATAR